MTTRKLITVAGILAAIVVSYWIVKSQFGEPSAKLIIAEGTQPIAAPVYVAFSKGFFKDEGLDVQLVSFPTGRLCLDALIGGKADFATAAETPIMHASFKKNPIRIVATMHRSRQNTLIVARRDLGVVTPADLKGKAVAVPYGTNAEYALDAFLTHNGLLRSDLQLINLSPPEMIGPFLKGDVAAVVAWQPHAGRCEKDVKDAVTFSFAPVYEETYNMVASEAIVKNNMGTIAKVLKALDRAIEYMKQNPDESIGIVAERIGMDKAELTQLWPIYNFQLDLQTSLVETLQAQGKWAVGSGHQSGSVPDMQDFISPAPLKSFKPESVALPSNSAK